MLHKLLVYLFLIPACILTSTHTASAANLSGSYKQFINIGECEQVMRNDFESDPDLSQLRPINVCICLINKSPSKSQQIDSRWPLLEGQVEACMREEINRVLGECEACHECEHGLDHEHESEPESEDAEIENVNAPEQESPPAENLKLFNVPI